MPSGFFASSLVIKAAPGSTIPQCGVCGLFKGCQTPKMPFSGEGKRKILIVGEAPGEHEDEKGKQFIGKSGQYLRDALNMLGIDMRRDCWLTNAIICRPPNNKISHKKTVNYCRPNLTKTLNVLQPNVVIPLGGVAVNSLISEIWKEHPGSISRWVGWDIPCQKINAWICPTYHPSYLLREESSILDTQFIEHLMQALAHENRPWDKLPNWEDQVEVILDADEAARMIDKVIEKGGIVGFDYENNCLKPETDGAEILCASVCWEGKKTFSYPWYGAAIEASQRLLHSDSCRFVASNMKHEDRWTRKAFGRGVRHWAWDTMLAAHTLDNRGEISGLKFQAFVNLGQPSYDDAIKRLLRPLAGKKLNRAGKEIDIHQLLKYCGCDSLLEVLVAEKQYLKFRNR